MIITIGRQFGSGGHAVGRSVAARLGIPCYDRELLTLAAEKSGIDPTVFSRIEETAANSFLYAASMAATGHITFQADSVPLNDKLFLVQSEIIRAKAEEGPCVFVGRCADAILEDKRPLSVFIRADMDFRIARITESERCTPEEAESVIVKADKRRAKYYNFYTQKRWGAVESYDMMFNTARLGLDGTVEMICAAINSIPQN